MGRESFDVRAGQLRFRGRDTPLPASVQRLATAQSELVDRHEPARSASASSTSVLAHAAGVPSTTHQFANYGQQPGTACTIFSKRRKFLLYGQPGMPDRTRQQQPIANDRGSF